MKEILKLNTINLEANTNNKYRIGNNSYFLYHDPDEPPKANKLIVEAGDLKAELQPSKGLSLGQAFYKEKEIFWDAPYSLPNPDTLNLWSDDILINGEPHEGFEFLKTFCGGIEFYGLKNWGMPVKDPTSGQLLPLHGETSNIPVEEVTIKIAENNIIVEAEYIYRDMKKAEPQPWYQNGNPLYKVHKYYEFCLCERPKIIIKDTIENISDKDLVPDWGYHITFYPHPETKLIVNSTNQEMRGGGNLPENIDKWKPSGEKGKREEIGILHKGLEKFQSGNEEKCSVLIQHPEGDKIFFHFPASPYFQTWSCKGGAGSDEFKLKNGQSLLEKNWDGIGIEIGSSALDHDGNTDNSVKYDSVLKPGDKKIIEMELEYMESE